jgi:hypothetical protein
MSGNDNLQPFLDAAETTIRKQIARLRRADRLSLEAHYAIGQTLCDVRQAMKWRPFLVWADEKFGYKKSWVSWLMWLHNNRKTVEDVLASVGDRTDTKATRTNYTPDGAYLLVQQMKPIEAKNSKKAPAAGKATKAELEGSAPEVVETPSSKNEALPNTEDLETAVQNGTDRDPGKVAGQSAENSLLPGSVTAEALGVEREPGLYRKSEHRSIASMEQRTRPGDRAPEP